MYSSTLQAMHFIFVGNLSHLESHYTKKMFFSPFIFLIIKILELILKNWVYFEK